MALVEYSDSDESDTQEKPNTVLPKPKATSKTNLRFVDRANPGKIKVTLPQAALTTDQDGEPAAKRARTSTDGSSSFNSLLPPPRRSGSSLKLAAISTSASKGPSLKAGVNLKTGAAPGFNREIEVGSGHDDNYNEGVSEETFQMKGSSLSLPPPKALQRVEQMPTEEVKVTAKSRNFKPLSVAKKTMKKKNSAISPASSNAPVQPITSDPPLTTKPTKPKVSLFSLSAEPSELESEVYDDSANLEPSFSLDHSNDLLEPSYEDYTPNASFTSQIPPAVPTPPSTSQTISQPQSLAEIASDLNLTPSERRRLFGRNPKSDSAKVISFSTENEYAQNELLRQSQEGQPVKNPVRSLAPGKHSLKQLMNAVQTQKEAFEESFSEGKGKRKEAGGRYGW